MRGWIAVAAGLFGLVAYVRRRRQGSGASQVEAEPAEELRAKLAEKRDPPADPEPSPEPDAEAEPDSVGERRQDVHDRARAAIDELG